MFTGLVADLGDGRPPSTPTGDGVRLAVRSALAAELREGDSVAVNGVCLTATAVDDGALHRRRDARDAAPLLARGRSAPARR